MIEIKHRSGRVLYTSETATDTREAVEEAVRRAADLRSANIRSANLGGADLYAANLYAANLGGADLYAANLYAANLGGADLRGANLRGANLYAANLRGANLAAADGITFNAGPSGHGHLLPLDADGKHDRTGRWRITIGCWRHKTLDDLRALIDDKAEWPEAEGDERDRRRPYLAAVLALCEAHIAYHEAV